MSKGLSTRLYLVRLAKRKTSLHDLNRFTRNATDLRYGYEITFKSLDSLLSEGLIRIEDKRIVLGELSPSPWLRDDLVAGESEAWEIVETYSPKAWKFDPDESVQSELGSKGEDYVFQALEQQVPSHLVRNLQHVSKFDDSAGFDIVTPINDGGQLGHLEVKTSSRSGGEHRFFLTRNEWNQSLRLKNWFLVLVVIKEGSPELFGHIDSASLSAYLPVDGHRNFRWQTVRGALALDEVFPGLPLSFDSAPGF